MSFSSFLQLLRVARTPKSFFLFILPFSVILGTVLPHSAAPELDRAGLALVQLIAFPAIPLVLSAVMISISNIFSIHGGGSVDQFRFICTVTEKVFYRKHESYENLIHHNGLIYYKYVFSVFLFRLVFLAMFCSHEFLCR